MPNEEEEPIFSKIDKDVKDRAQRYITESKIAGIKKTDTFKNLIELSLTEYMNSHTLD